MTTPFRRVLIANRGEIAVRVIRACRRLGIETVAVYSAADAGALHTRMADQAREIGPAPAAESYLDVGRVLEVARDTGADAVHPGYGFLSENPTFAEACAAAGITFVGPPPEAMRLVGDKAAARRLAAANGVPIVPGYDDSDQDDTALGERALVVGFPLLVKAAAGGGGRGMRIVRDPAHFPEALASARREARAAFGDGTVLLERYVSPARHVEVQILGDHHGRLVHLGERDCSVQRRHQKVVEESPSPAVSRALRAELGSAALHVASAAGYTNAGTCEFLLDRDGHFYFLEMNARLQVEHPVTELVTGLDLVELQLRIAAGEPLGLVQDDVTFHGHALECRLYAEDPDRDFLPTGGRLTRFVPPTGDGLRHDVGYATGDSVPTFYDPMLAKLIASGPDRPTALDRARRALDRYLIGGVATNVSLLRWVLDHPTFVAGEATTDFLAEQWQPAADAPPPPDEALAATAAYELAKRPEPSGDPWRSLGPWRLLDEGIPLAYDAAGLPRPTLARRAERPADSTVAAWSVTVGGRSYRAIVDAAGTVVVECDGERRSFGVEAQPGGFGFLVRENETRYAIERAKPPAVGDAARRAGVAGGDARLEAPMPGRVVKVVVEEGERVRQHQTLVILEAMKIEHAVAAPRDGLVLAVHAAAGQAVDGGALLVELAAEGPDA